MLKKIKRPALTFMLSYLLLLLPFAIAGLHPFGDRQIMIIDSWHQYYPILQELQYKLQHGHVFSYTWHSGGGSNFLLMMTYYAMSPLNVFAALVPADYLREFMAYLTLFRIAFAGMAMTIYLQVRHDHYDVSTVLFGLLYAFCGFFMGYYWNAMWLDVVAILPLIILGLYQLVYKRRFLLYVISLAYAIISNYYVAFFVCFFIAIYSIVMLIAEGEHRTLKHIAITLIRIVTFSLIAVGLAGVVLLPVINGMQLAYGLSSSDPTAFKLYETTLDIVNRLLPFVKPSVIDGLPNIALGTLGLMMFALYFIQAKQPLRAKLSYGLLLVFLLISTNINYLNFIWHGLHFPNQVPFRFAFLVSFLMVSVAYQGYLQLATTPRKQLFAVLAGFTVYLLIAEQIGDSETFSYVVYGTLAFVALYGGIMLWVNAKSYSMSLLTKLCIVIFVIEALVMTGLAVGAARTTSRSSYPADHADVQRALTAIRQSDSAVYRIELSPLYTANDPLLYRYRGVSQFSSTANTHYTKWTKLFGLSSNEPSNSYKYLPNTPVTNGFLGINYIVSRNSKFPAANQAYQPMASFGNVSAYHSRYPMPFAFAVSRNIYLDIAYDKSPFVRQEHWLARATALNSELFSDLIETASSFDNIALEDKQDIRYRYKNIDAKQTGTAHLDFAVPATRQVYLYVKNQMKTVSVTAAGQTHSYDPRRGVVIDLGVLNGGSTIQIELPVKAQSSGFFDVHAVSWQPDNYQTAYDELVDEPLVIEQFNDGYLRGSIDMQMEGVLYTSIPYEPGWQALVDGQPAQIMPIQNAVISLPLGAGLHRVELRYQPAGLTSGLIVSAVSLVLLIALVIVTWRGNEATKQHAIAERAASDDTPHSVDAKKLPYEYSLPELDDEAPRDVISHLAERLADDSAKEKERDHDD